MYTRINWIWDGNGGLDVFLLRLKKAVNLLLLVAMFFWACCVGVIGIQLALMSMSHTL